MLIEPCLLVLETDCIHGGLDVPASGKRAPCVITLLFLPTECSLSHCHCLHLAVGGHYAPTTKEVVTLKVDIQHNKVGDGLRAGASN